MSRDRLLAIAGLGFIALMTLQPHPEAAYDAARTPLWCVLCGDYGLLDVLLNVLLFLPYGAGLRLAGVSWRRTLLLVAATSFTVEFLQYTVVAGRDASLSDLLTNTTGGALGWLLVGAVPHLLRPQAPLRRRLLAGWTALWLALLALTAFAERRSLPHSTYYGQWAAELGGHDLFRGRVLGAWIGGRALPGWRLRDGAAVRTRLLADTVTLDVRAVAAGATRLSAPIFSIFDEQQREIVMLDQVRRDAIFRIRTHAADLELRPPAVRLPQALADSDDTLHLAAGLRDGHLWLATTGRRGTRRMDVPLTPTLGWVLLLPYRYALGPEYPLLSALWLFGMLLPLGFWSGRGEAGDSHGRSPAPLASAAPAAAWAALAVAGPAVVALAAGLPSPQWWEWLAGLGGVAAGWVLARWVARRGSGRRATADRPVKGEAEAYAPTPRRARRASSP